jgi:hypothetical protein
MELAYSYVTYHFTPFPGDTTTDRSLSTAKGGSPMHTAIILMFGNSERRFARAL